MPERRPDPVLGHPLTEALQGLLDGGATRHGYQTARKPPFERYEPWAKGCLWAYAEPAGGPPDGWDFRPKSTTWDAYLRFPR